VAHFLRPAWGRSLCIFLKKPKVRAKLFPIAGSNLALVQMAVEAQYDRGKFFIWILCNPLKSPDSAKGIQGNPSFFPWFYLVLLGFIWSPNTVRGERFRLRGATADRGATSPRD
jgi:hypothetical protein